MSLLLRKILWGHDVFTKICFWLGCFALFLIVAIFAYEVFMRYFLAAPTKWGSDFVSFLLLGSVFLVLPYVTRIRGNVSVTILIELLGEDSRAADLIRRFGYAVGAAVCIWAGIIFLNETQRLFERGTTTLTTIPFPKWVLFVFITVGTLNAGLYFLRLTFGDDAGDRLEGE